MYVSKAPISFFRRALTQFPALILSAGTMVMVARNLGPTGRGEISSALLITAIFSQILTTPVFLVLMQIEDRSVAGQFISNSLRLFSRFNLTLMIVFNALLIFINHIQGWLSLPSSILLNTIVITYFVSTQIRDYLLKLHYSNVYFLDFFIQLIIALPILAMILTSTLTVFRILIVFSLAYVLLACVLVSKFKALNSYFKVHEIIKKPIPAVGKGEEWHLRGLLTFSGLIIYIALNKDAFMGFLILEKSEFGLMSAVASFWIAFRFLRPMTILQTKLDDDMHATKSHKTFKVDLSKSKRLSNLRRQLIVIAISGSLSWLLAPFLMGEGFQPSISMSIAGFSSEMLLMVVIYEISMKPSKMKIAVINVLCLIQIALVVTLGLTTDWINIVVIWISSIIFYLFWLIFFKFSEVESNG